MKKTKEPKRLVFSSSLYKIHKIPLNYQITYTNSKGNEGLSYYTDDDCGLEYAKEVAEYHLNTNCGVSGGSVRRVNAKKV